MRRIAVILGVVAVTGMLSMNVAAQTGQRGGGQGGNGQSTGQGQGQGHDDRRPTRILKMSLVARSRFAWFVHHVTNCIVQYHSPRKNTEEFVFVLDVVSWYPKSTF